MLTSSSLPESLAAENDATSAAKKSLFVLSVWDAEDAL